MGEKNIERVFKENGYKIFYPEQLSLYEQIKLVANASFYVCVQGSLEHNSLFMKTGATLVVLKRQKQPTYRQLLINKAQKGKIKHIYLRTNVQPMGEKALLGFVGATKDCLSFFDRNNFAYNAQELKPKFQDLLKYIDMHLSNDRQRRRKRMQRKLNKLISHNNRFWKDIN